MRHLVIALLLLPVLVSAQHEYIHKGEQNGVEMAYRWKHPIGKPSELHLRLKQLYFKKDFGILRKGYGLASIRQSSH